MCAAWAEEFELDYDTAAATDRIDPGLARAGFTLSRDLRHRRALLLRKVTRSSFAGPPSDRGRNQCAAGPASSIASCSPELGS